MLGYILLAAATLMGATKGYCGKKTSSYVRKPGDAMLVNAVRMFFCILIGFAAIMINDGVQAFAVSPKMLAITALSGITTSVFVIVWLIAVRTGAYMMLDVFLMLGVLVPTMGSVIFFGETIKFSQIIGFVFLLAAAAVMCSYNNSIKGKLTVKSIVLLILCGVFNGLTDFSQKIFVHEITDSSALVFNFYTYIFAAAVLVISAVFLSLKGDNPTVKVGSIIIYVLVMSVCLFLNSFLKTTAASMLPSIVVYPLSQGLGLIISTAMSALLFKEKLTKKSIAGVLIAFSGLIIINCL